MLIFPSVDVETEAQGHVFCEWQRSDVNPEFFHKPEARHSTVPDGHLLQGRRCLLQAVPQNPREALHKKKWDITGVRLPWLFPESQVTLFGSSPASSALGAHLELVSQSRWLLGKGDGA